MKVDLKELAAAFAQSDVRQGYVDTAAGKVIMMADDLAERDAMHYAMVMEEDWERYIPIPNIMDGDEAAMMRAFAESRPREAVKERLLTALHPENRQPDPRRCRGHRRQYGCQRIPADRRIRQYL